MPAFITIIVVAITIEAIVEYFGQLIVNRAWNWKVFGAMALGVVLACLAQIDLYALIGVTFTWPWIGYILTGLIASRGANYVSDFISLVTSKVAQAKKTI